MSHFLSMQFHSVYNCFLFSNFQWVLLVDYSSVQKYIWGFFLVMIYIFLQEIRSQDSKVARRTESWASVRLKLWREIVQDYGQCCSVLKNPFFGDVFCCGCVLMLCAKRQDHILSFGAGVPPWTWTQRQVCVQGISTAVRSAGPCNMGAD